MLLTVILSNLSVILDDNKKVLGDLVIYAKPRAAKIIRTIEKK